MRFTSVPDKIKQQPNDKSCNHTFPLFISTNCGKKVIKNNPTFGFKDRG